MKDPLSSLNKATATLASVEEILNTLDASQPDLTADIENLLEQHKRTKKKITLALVWLTDKLLPFATFIQSHNGNRVDYKIKPLPIRHGIYTEETFYVDLQGRIQHVTYPKNVPVIVTVAIEEFTTNYDALHFCQEIIYKGQQLAEEDAQHALKIKVLYQTVFSGRLQT